MGKKYSTKQRKLAMRLMQRGTPAKLIVYLRDKGRCAYCGVEMLISDATIDHIIPVASGGTEDLDNLTLACETCNHNKGAMSAEEFRKCISLGSTQA